jgi:hypothetical protein
VHWRSSARTGRLLVREYEDELAREVVIAVDNALPAGVRGALADGRADADALAHQEALERAVSHAASLAVAYLGRGWSVGIAARGLALAPAAGPGQRARVLEALALLPATGDDVALPSPGARESVLVLPAEAPRATAAPGFRPRGGGAMTFATVHKATTYAMVGSAMLGLVGGGMVSPIFSALGVLGLIASWFWEPPRVNVDRWSPLWTVLSVLMLVYGLVTGLATGDYLGVGAQFLIWLVVAKAFTRRALRDWQQLHLLSLLMLVAGSVLNVDLIYGLSSCCSW